MILVVAAMQEEIKEIAKSILPNNHLIVTGVGKVNAAMKLTEALQKEEIEVILNVGFAGASEDYHVGDLVIVSKTRYHDFNLTMFGYEEGQVPGYPTYFVPDSNWMKNIKNKYSTLKEGELLTGDFFMSGHVSQNKLFDMEGASLFQVAHHYQVPIVSIKVVSDIVTMDKHIENYQKFEAEEGAKRLYDVYNCLFGGKK